MGGYKLSSSLKEVRKTRMVTTVLFHEWVKSGYAMGEGAMMSRVGAIEEGIIWEPPQKKSKTKK